MNAEDFRMTLEDLRWWKRRNPSWREDKRKAQEQARAEEERIMAACALVKGEKP